MNQFGFCLACQKPLSEENQFANSIICSCGYTMKNNATTKADKGANHRISAVVIAIGVILSASFVHAVNWDNHFFSVIPLKMKDMTGTASISDLRALAQICEDRMKYDCMEDSYKQIYHQHPQDISILSELGSLQERRGRFLEATKTLGLYFELEGDDLNASYAYAKALGAVGRIEEASIHYKRVLDAKPDVLQVTVTKSYVNMLLEQDRLKEAQDIIEFYRKQGTNTGYFMDQELKTIQRKLASQS